MSRDRGNRLQNALAAYLRSKGWPSAESVGAGRPGTDVLGTPGIVWENKTADEWDILEWVRQCRKHTPWITPNEPVNWPITVYWPRGSGEKSVESTLSIVPTGVMVRLLREAGYGDQ